MQYLIAVDLEGVHGVVGEKNSAMKRGSFDYDNAVEAATLEVNAAVKALFDNGAESVAVWDNHGGGGNLDFDKIDSRVIRIDASRDAYRFDFVKNYHFSGILFLGYHAKEGTPRGVLAHTFSSVGIQYVKLNGAAIGELGVDTYICDAYGIPPLFIAGDDVCLAEMKAIRPDIVSVITKYGKGRNRAEFKDRAQVLQEIYDGVSEAVKRPQSAFSYQFPQNAHLEVRYTRAERAEDIYLKTTERNTLPVHYGEDTHILHFEIGAANQIPKLL